jgi:hypothetical protein
MEFDVAQFGPRGTEKIGCRADRDIEALEPGVERSDRRADDRAPALTAVPPMAIRAWAGIAPARRLSSPSDHASILGRCPGAHPQGSGPVIRTAHGGALWPGTARRGRGGP